MHAAQYCGLKHAQVTWAPLLIHTDIPGLAVAVTADIEAHVAVGAA